MIVVRVHHGPGDRQFVSFHPPEPLLAGVLDYWPSVSVRLDRCGPSSPQRALDQLVRMVRTFDHESA